MQGVAATPQNWLRLTQQKQSHPKNPKNACHFKMKPMFQPLCFRVELLISERGTVYYSRFWSLIFARTIPDPREWFLYCWPNKIPKKIGFTRYPPFGSNWCISPPYTRQLFSVDVFSFSKRWDVRFPEGYGKAKTPRAHQNWCLSAPRWAGASPKASDWARGRGFCARWLQCHHPQLSLGNTRQGPTYPQYPWKSGRHGPNSNKCVQKLRILTQNLQNPCQWDWVESSYNTIRPQHYSI